MLFDLHIKQIIEINLLTAKCKARWPKNFDAKKYIQQKKPNCGLPFYICNNKKIYIMQ